MVEINNWLRQARYRAKKNGVGSTLTKEQIIQVWTAFDGRCAYCAAVATALDNPVPLCNGAPNVQANLLPICNSCKVKKRNHTICWMHECGHIQLNIYTAIMEQMLVRAGRDEVKAVLRRLLGISD